MLKLERQLFIEKELHEKGSVLVSELSKVLDCSEETIRRDIKEMEAAGKLNKIHGGAYLPDKYDKGVPIELRESFFASEKEQMADKAVDIIKDHSVIMLDSSTTCLKLAEAMYYIDHQFAAYQFSVSFPVIQCESDLSGWTASSGNCILYRVSDDRYAEAEFCGYHLYLLSGTASAAWTL